MNLFGHSNLGSCLFMAPDRADREKEIMLDERLRWTIDPQQYKKRKQTILSNKENARKRARKGSKIQHKMNKYTMKIDRRPEPKQVKKNEYNSQISIHSSFLEKKQFEHLHKKRLKQE